MNERKQLRHDVKHLLWQLRKALDDVRHGRADRCRGELESAIERAELIRSAVWSRRPL